MSTNVFHYGQNNGEEGGVYVISSGDGGSKIMLSVVTAGSAAVNGKMVVASEGGRRLKSAYVTDAEVGLTGYVMFRRDRIGRRGRGVILYVR